MAAHQVPVYDRIGGQYHRGRREDPRIAARIRAAREDASRETPLDHPGLPHPCLPQVRQQMEQLLASRAGTSPGSGQS